MLKVLIADDEKKVCRLISMLCDWEQLDMEPIGFVCSGIEAIEAMKEQRPDILITDVCMPGCDGIDLIRYIREQDWPVEIAIISGYADFKYAQSAMRYGVNDYLLKPIKKKELEETLKGLGERCRQEQARIQANSRLTQYLKDDTLRRRCSLFFSVLLSGGRHPVPSMEELNGEYGFRFKDGICRILILKLDYQEEKYAPSAVSRIMDGLEEIIRDSLKDVCEDYEIWRDGDRSYIVCNYLDENSHLFRQAVRSGVDNIGVKRFKLWETRYSLGMGPSVRDCAELNLSLEGAEKAVMERLLEGCEKLLEAPYHKPGIDVTDVISLFQYESVKYMDQGDEKLTAECVNRLKERLLAEKGITGEELFNIVVSLGIYAISQARPAEHTARETEFRRRCSLCSGADELFGTLSELLCSIIRNIRERQAEETRKPVRMAKQYIQNHFTEPLSLETVAEKAGFSASYFSSLFKKEMGTGFNEYLTSLRVERAKELLKTTRLNVREICEQVGYSDLKHFTAVFRKNTGLKPGEYRKLYG